MSTPEASISCTRCSASKNASRARKRVLPKTSVLAVLPSTGSICGKQSGASTG